MKNTIFFKPAPQIENTGDLLINKSELTLLREYGKVIIDDSKAPDWFLKDIIIEGKDVLLSSISNKPLHWAIAEYIRKMKRSGINDEKVILFIHPGHRSRKGFKSVLKTIYNIIKDRSIRKIGCDLVRVGFSIGPYDKPNGFVDALASKNYNYFGLRDNKSMCLAKELDFKDPKYFPDLAWAYNPDYSKKVGENGDYVVLSFRSNQYGEHHSEKDLKPIAEKLKALLLMSGNKQKIMITYQVKYDREASVYINNLLAEEFSTEFIDRKLSLAEAEELYSKANYVLSNRLHVLLLAFQCGTLALPFIVPNDNKKIVGIYSDNGMDDLMLDSTLETEVLTAQLNTAISGKAAAMAHFHEAASANTKIIKDSLDIIFS